jgi:Neurotransmitter-gated ion-channel ligand binding domain
MRTLTIVLLLLSATAASVQAANARPANATETPKPQHEIDLQDHPTGGKTPVEVTIGLYVTNLVSIDETRESFELGGYLEAMWKDPRLALPADTKPGANGRTDTPRLRAFKPEQIWMPAIQATNTITHKTNGYDLEVDANGVVTYTERFDVALSNEYFLRKFPFDTQVLRFELEPFRSPTSAIVFAPQALQMTGISPGRNTELASWRIEGLRYLTPEVPGRAIVPGTRESVFELTISRRPAFYIWKIFLPLMMISLIPMVVFWINAKEFDWLLKIPMTMLLSMVAFELAITRDLPRVGYITFLDAVFVTGFALCFLCILEILTVYLIYNRGLAQRANRIHASGRWLYPLTYFGVLALLALFFF